MTNCSAPAFHLFQPDLARSLMAPRPVLKYCLMPSMPQISPPVGKSAPLMFFINSAMVMLGLSICAQTLQCPLRIVSGMLVAMPTAMPVPPLTRSSEGGREDVGSVMRSS